MAKRSKVPRRRLAKKKPSERALLGIVRVVQVLDEETGSLVRMKGVFPAYALDRREMNERGLRNNDMVMLDVFKDRNPRFWRLFHRLAAFLADNVMALSGFRAHAALKQVQLDANVHCKYEAIEPDEDTAALLVEAGIKSFGFRRRTTMSLNFDDTDETIATEVWDRICDYTAEKYFPLWDAGQVADAAAHWERDDT